MFTGVSGSGRGSLVFATVAAESQRMLNETYSAFLQWWMPTMARPDVDALDGLATAILVDQQRMGADPRSTVGTAADDNALLRILSSRPGQPHIGSPQAFASNVASVGGAGAVRVGKAGRTVRQRRSFEATGSMCPRCEGRDSVNDIDLTQLHDDTKSLNEGALSIPGTPPMAGTTAGTPRRAWSIPTSRSTGTRSANSTTCSTAGPSGWGSRGVSIADACAMQVGDLAAWVRTLDADSVRSLLERCSTCSTRRHARARPPVARPPDRHPQRRRGPAHEDNPPPRLGAHRRGLRLRRTRHRLHPHDIEHMNQLLLQLRDVSVDIPLGVLCVVTGVAGSGKSSLVHGSMPASAGAVSIDQAPVRGSRRSNPATYSGLLDPIRKDFAKTNGVKPALLSPRSEGACHHCNAAGAIDTEQGFMDKVAIVCEGTPADLVAHPATLTCEHLAAWVAR